MNATSTESTVAPEDVELHARDWLAIALPGLIWGSSFFLIAEGLDAFSPYLVTWMRIAFGLSVLAAVPAARRPVPRNAWPMIATLGLVWMAVPLTLFSLAEQRVSSSVTGMLNGANPVFTAAVAAIIVAAFPPRRQQLGLLVGLGGIVLIALPSWSDGGSSAGGVMMILAALACYGVALNLAGPIQRRLGSLPVIVRGLAVAFVLTAPLGLAGIGDSVFAWRSAAAVAVLGAFGTGLAFVQMASNAGRYGGTRAASTTYLIPAVSLFLGLVFRSESVEAMAIVGSSIALAGAYLVNTSAPVSRLRR
jgi:drug/metabolite transporter (DMT)-like permease